MTRNRVASGTGQKKSAHRANRHSQTGFPMRGLSQDDKPTDEPDIGPHARTATGVKLKCIRNTHG